eukprot:CAMPEP_0116118300 /NCGR_PEP_ID=MMETSP0329-20121206/2029_1 /TAXON_ID=697910 /ORGANISM="Pseudo-nitzschia arenysensis, Strain B593" /LENGTH=642 /DNA_ID=CAMNT_0003611915 /DNA_START=13 /DNA_END=1941 /DNA_ORIENTATION=-
MEDQSKDQRDGSFIGCSSSSSNSSRISPSATNHFRASRSYSFDEAGDSAGLMARTRRLGRFRSKSRDFGGDNYCKQQQQTNDQLVAVKIFSKSNLKRRRTIERDKSTNRMKVKTALQQVQREIALMKKLTHPNLVRLYEVIDSPETDILYMVLEYMPLGEILTFREQDGTFKRSESLRHKQVEGLVDAGHFDEEHAALYMVDILHGLAYLHQHHICHRDLKPENILLSDNGIAKVGDFGVSHIFEEEKTESSSSKLLASIDEDRSHRRFSSQEEETTAKGSGENNDHPVLTRHDSESAYDLERMAGTGILTKTEGTWCFWSPEMCSGGDSNGFSGYAADMWAAGVCLYIFVTGKLPFYNTVPLDLFEMIETCDVQYEGLGLSEPLIDLLQSCLEKDPNKRAGVGDCLHHPFLQAAREQRIRQLGPEFEISERTSGAIITEDDIRMAFRTVTSVPVQVLRSAGKKLQEGFCHTRDNLMGRIPSLGYSSDTETTENCKNKQGNNNHVVFYSRQTSGDSAQSDPGGYRLTLHHNHHRSHNKHHETESETDTHVSKLSSAVSFGSTTTEELQNNHPLTSRVSFGSNNTDELPVIPSEDYYHNNQDDEEEENEKLKDTTSVPESAPENNPFEEGIIRKKTFSSCVIQ